MTINWDFWEDVPEDVGQAIAHVAKFCDEYDWSFELFWAGDRWETLIITESESGSPVELEGHDESVVHAIRYVIELAKVYYEEGTW